MVTRTTKNKTQDKWIQLDIMHIQYLVGTNHCLPLSHMAKSYIWLEEKNQRINEFSIEYMMNPNLFINKAFKEQVKICLKTKFSTTILSHISKISLKPDTRVLALVMFHENRKKTLENVQSFESCNICNYKQLCLYWLFRFWDFFKSDLNLGYDGIYKHFNKSYENVLGFGIPDLLMNLLSCHGFLKNNDYIVILKFPNRMFEYYFNKVLIIFDCDKKVLERLLSEIKDRIGA